ncbi:MAG: endonuclease/exonuclease/phosphatase family protein [Phycisphaerae bacterium]|nr:endonuclease/exonuclease/phosphatase family protein [Phycisphaerae bacterium]
MKYLFVLFLASMSFLAFAEPITLMTFNIRYGTASDGPNSWHYRKDHVVETIRDAHPAVIAIQEAFLDQLTYLDEQLNAFTKIGQHRSGNTKGEFSGLLIDTRKLEILEQGQLWLSETPEEISIGWDAALPRTATWAKVRAVGTSSPSFILFSTHFDHQGKEARIESAKLICKKANELSEGNIPVAIMGDFNCSDGSAPYKVFTGSGFTTARTCKDCGTFHEFTGREDVPNIDFIWLNDKWKGIHAETLRPRKNGKCASDHDPVVATLEPKVPSGTIGMARFIQQEWQPSQDSLVRPFIPMELQEEVAKLEQLITSRPETEPDFHELTHVHGAFKFPFHLPELAGDLTDRLMALHCEPSNIRALARQVLDTKLTKVKTDYSDRPTVEQVMEFLSIPNETFYIEEAQLASALEVINYSMQIDFDALVATIQIPNDEKQPFFGKAMPPGVTGPILAGQMGPDGWRVVGGAGANTYDMSLIAEVFDLGGDDSYFANDIVVGNRKVVDLGGNDSYTGTEKQGPAAGLFGTWIIDDRGGDDVYGTIGGTFSTGAGCFGVGMIIDRAGNDTYHGTQWSIGSAVYGVGIVMDLGNGDDEYLGEFLSIGVGGPRGFGFVFDEDGNDFYKSEGPKPSIYETADVYCAFSQGMGFGYRKYAAGGIGILCDVAGDDKYQAGEFSQGGAYYHGLGILRDFSGDDDYHGNRYAQGFGVHQAFGVLIDDAGDDTYWAMTAADQGSAWDIAAGCLLDKSGDDSYTANSMTQGSAAMQGIAYLIDLDGEDLYSGTHPAQGESGSNTYHWEPSHSFSFSALLDFGGRDDMYSLERNNNSTEITQPNPKPEGSGIGLFIDQ